MSYALKIAEPDDIEPYFTNFLQTEHSDLVKLEQKYCGLMDELQQTQTKLKAGISKNHQKLKQMESAIKRLRAQHETLEESQNYKKVMRGIEETHAQYKDFKLGLPKKPKYDFNHKTCIFAAIIN